MSKPEFSGRAWGNDKSVDAFFERCTHRCIRKGKGRRKRSKERCKEVDLMYCRASSCFTTSCEETQQAHSLANTISLKGLQGGTTLGVVLGKEKRKGRIYLPGFLLYPVLSWWGFLSWEWPPVISGCPIQALCRYSGCCIPCPAVCISSKPKGDVD